MTFSDSHEAPEALLERALESGRIHSAYLVAGPTEPARALALRFARALVCTADRGARPCGSCAACRRSDPGAPGHEPVALDGSGKKGPLYRHVGDHPDLLWLERGADDTRVRIGQIRALQAALRMSPNEGGARAVIIADAEWLNAEAQNALLRTLEEPPPRTTLVLVTRSAASLLATVRSRCQRVVLRSPAGEPLLGDDVPEAIVGWRERLPAVASYDLPELLDLAEEFRGARAEAAENLTGMLDVGGALLRECVRRQIAQEAASAAADAAPAAPPRALRAALEAERELRLARRALQRWNANPQMVAERALFALRRGLA